MSGDCQGKYIERKDYNEKHTIKEEDVMLKKGWDFIKENVAAIVTVVTTILTVVYAIMRLCIFVYWNGYFTRLNIDRNVMNINFDKSIFFVVFVSIVLFVVLFFVAWAYETVTDIFKKEKERQLKGVKWMISKIKAYIKALFLSLIILSIINLPLTMLLAPLMKINISIIEMCVIFLFLYVMEMFLLILEITTETRDKKKEKAFERDVAFKIIGMLAIVLVIISALFYGGTQAIDNKTNIQLVENEEYMISYCDGEYYVLHKVKYEEGEITIYRNEQKIVAIEDYEYSIKNVEKIIVED